MTRQEFYEAGSIVREIEILEDIIFTIKSDIAKTYCRIDPKLLKKAFLGVDGDERMEIAKLLSQGLQIQIDNRENLLKAIGSSR